VVRNVSYISLLRFYGGGGEEAVAWLSRFVGMARLHNNMDTV